MANLEHDFKRGLPDLDDRSLTVLSAIFTAPELQLQKFSHFKINVAIFT